MTNESFLLFNEIYSENRGRIVALVGSSIDNPRYIKTTIGSEMSTILGKEKVI